MSLAELLAMMLALLAGPSAGDDDDSAADDELDETIEIVATREAEAPFQKHLDHAALQTLPARTTGQLLRAVPGLQLSEHGGHGKALQYLTRGFDAAHGTDVAVSLEGIPLNEVSNVHGQGYLDLHFLPTLLVNRLEVSKGPHRPDRGDFAIAASADYGLGLSREGLVAQVIGGTDASLQAALALRPPGSEEGTFVAIDGQFGEGNGSSRAWHLLRGGAGLQGTLRPGLRGRVFLLGHSGSFESPSVLRLDDLQAGRIDRLGAYPGDRGGTSRRVLGAARIEAGGGPWLLQATAWGGGRWLALRSNFTGFARDPVHGDTRSQRHDAASLGGEVRGHRSFSLWDDRSMLRAGAQLRLDDFTQSEDDLDMGGSLIRRGLAARGLQADLAAWAEGDLGIRQVLRFRAGLRVDTFGIRSQVDRDVHGQPTGSAVARSWTFVPTPHLRVSARPTPPLELFASWGRGLRSPQARGVVDGQPAPVARSDTVEGGARLQLPSRLDVRGVFFATWLDDELVFDHVAGRFAGSGATRRLGVELTAAVRPVERLRLELEAAWADGRFVASGEPIPFAPRWMLVAGAYLEPTPLGRGGAATRPKLSAGLRGQLLLARPLPWGFASKPSFVLDATARLDLGSVTLLLAVDNLLGLPWNDGEFVYASCFHPDEGCSQLPAVHITTGTAWTARGGLEIALGPRRHTP